MIRYGGSRTLMGKNLCSTIVPGTLQMSAEWSGCFHEDCLLPPLVYCARMLYNIRLKKLNEWISVANWRVKDGREFSKCLGSL